MREPEPTVVPTAAGDLRALIFRPSSEAQGGAADGATDAGAVPDTPDALLPGLVLVNGAGDGTADGWGRWPQAITDCGAVVLTHDKPGCGGSPGRWTKQSMADRAAESLAALEVLRARPGVDPERMGLLGISQGGWVCQLAAATAPGAVDMIVAIAAAVSPVEQERYRIGVAVGGDEEAEEAMAWVDERARRLFAGEDPDRIVADQQAFAGRPWFQAACEHYTDPEVLAFYRALDFDPTRVIPGIRCPVFAAFGGADAAVPAQRSAALMSELLPPDPRHAVVVYPRADHNLFMVAERDPTVPLATELAVGFLPMLADWLAATGSPAS